MSLLSRLRRVLSRPSQVSREEFDLLKETLERTRAQLAVVSERVGSCPAPRPSWRPDSRESFERASGVTEYLSPLPWEVRVELGDRAVVLRFIPELHPKHVPRDPTLRRVLIYAQGAGVEFEFVSFEDYADIEAVRKDYIYYAKLALERRNE
jgi:hypothetical protein